MQPEALAASYRAALEIIDVVETNASFQNRSPYGEPQLGRRGLYQSVPDGTNPELAYLWLLNLSDGRHDLLAIAERSGLPFDAVREAAATLERARPPRAPGAEAVEVALVTGASRGIGRATALALAEDGFRVALVARSAAGLDETRELVRETTADAALDLVADVTDAEAVARGGRDGRGTSLGPVDVLVNNAGSLRAIGPLWEVRSRRLVGGRARRASAEPTTAAAPSSRA